MTPRIREPARRPWIRGGLIALSLWAAGPMRSRAEPGALLLARELDSCGDWAGSATEFRRLALEAAEPEARGAYLWWAGWQTRKAGQPQGVDPLADRVESADPGMTLPALLLRGYAAMDDGRWPEAAFYFGTVARSDGPEEARRLATFRMAEAHLRAGDRAAVRDALDGLDGADRVADAWAAFEAGRDKSPRLGGWLGMIPGAGYMYSGEWANGFRSLLLNGIFIFGMVHTAEEGQWGAFSAITFFQFTWYSGSIYGGVDAAHRYNRRRLEACAAVFREAAVLEPDAAALPGFLLRYRF